MPALNFKAQFAEDVELGVKRQTIRAPRRDGRAHCRVGDIIRLYTGMRTKGCRLLGEATVTAIRTVKIEPTGMELDGRPLYATLGSRDQIDPTDNEFAQADGFDSFMDMADWFRDAYGLPFEGVVIQWRDVR